MRNICTVRSVSGSRYGRLTPKILALLSLVLNICDPLVSISIDLWIIVIGPRRHWPVYLNTYTDSCCGDLPFCERSQVINWSISPRPDEVEIARFHVDLHAQDFSHFDISIVKCLRYRNWKFDYVTHGVFANSNPPRQHWDEKGTMGVAQS